jgi:hypothetical protein
MTTMNNEPTKTFENPVLVVDEVDRTRTTLVLDNKIKAAIERVHTKHGVINTTINIILQKLVHELERHNITSYDPGTYERAIIDCSVILGGLPAADGHELQRSPAPGSPTGSRPPIPTETNKRNVRRRTK